MYYRKDAVFMAVAGLLACSGLAMADSSKTTLSLNPVITAAEEPQTGLIMMGLDKAGVGKTLSDYNMKIYGWIEGGYTYNHRHGSDNAPIIPGPFNHEAGNHMMLNQLVIRFERSVDPTKFDVGGMVELMYGSDAARIHATGLGYNGSDATDDNNPSDPLAVSNLHPIWQFDIPQAYLDISVPVGNGLKFRVGKFVTLLGYETIDPRTNPFYSHSYLFSAVPFTQVGILGMYTLNDQWAITAGVTRGWDIALEDNNGDAIDTIGQIAFTPNKNWQVLFNWAVGPENAGDPGHYRVTFDPIVYWQVTDALKIGFEGLYEFDGGMNGSPSATHAYGDIWGAAAYASYKVNDYFTLNGRFEKAHTYSGSFGSFAGGSGIGGGFSSFGLPAISAYEATLGVTITPLPHDPIGRNLTVRPEIRYDWTDSSAFPFYVGDGGVHKDQLTFGVDAIFQF